MVASRLLHAESAFRPVKGDSCGKNLAKLRDRASREAIEFYEAASREPEPYGSSNPAGG
jgi:hypothetical protein